MLLFLKREIVANQISVNFYAKKCQTGVSEKQKMYRLLVYIQGLPWQHSQCYEVKAICLLFISVQKMKDKWKGQATEF